MTKLLKGSSVFVAGLCAAASIASVAKADGYGTAGCGLGSLIFHDKPGFIQVIAATFNGTAGNQTFAISSGTSNCGASEASATAAAAFIESNREAFAKDAARGNGETIVNLAALAGCQNPKAVGGVLQGEFQKIFTSSSATDKQVSGNALTTLKSHGELACKHLI